MVNINKCMGQRECIIVKVIFGDFEIVVGGIRCELSPDLFKMETWSLDGRTFILVIFKKSTSS